MATHEVMINTPSLMRFKAVMAVALRENSTIPSPVGFPRSSTTTTARSISPNILNASASISLEMCGDKYLTRSAAPCAANRTRNGRPRCMCPSIAARAFSAWWRVSFRHTTPMWYRDIQLYSQLNLKLTTYYVHVQTWWLHWKTTVLWILSYLMQWSCYGTCTFTPHCMKSILIPQCFNEPIII